MIRFKSTNRSPVIQSGTAQLDWVGSQISITVGETAVMCDPVTSYLGPPNLEVSTKVALRIQSSQERKLLLQKVNEAVRKFGGREGVIID